MSKGEEARSEEGGRRPGLLRSTSVVGGMTMLSRVMGLVRDIVFARFFGASLVMDAFFVAFKIPNIFRRFFAEGAFSQAFVPVFAEYDENRSKEEVRDLVDRVAGTLGIILFFFTAIGVIAAPLLIMAFAPGFSFSAETDDTTRYELAVQMLRWTFPYLLFISLTAMAGAVLNTYHRFGAPAFAPVLLNLVLISFAAFIAPGQENPGVWLAIGVFVAGLAQLVFMLPFLAGLGVMPRPKWGWQDSGVRRITKLMVPAIFGSSVAQINILFDTLIASFLVAGSISWLYFSDRLMEFPLGVFGIALATVILPNLSREHATQSAERFSAMLNWALKLVVLIAAPAAVGLFVLAAPALTTIFYGGRFTESDVDMATLSLMAYAFGLLGFTLVKVLAPGYFARQDTVTPVRIGIIALVANMGLNVLFVVPWVMLEMPGPHAGLALATSLSAFLNAGLLFRGLLRDEVLALEAGWPRLVLQVAVACGVMMVVLSLALERAGNWYEMALLARVGWLTVIIVAGAAAYLMALVAMGLRPASLRMKTG